VSPSRFESHLKYLKENGYQAITLDELLDFLATGKSLPEKPVVLTFDDGYADNYTNAFPLLQKYGMTGHFFIITDFVNEQRVEYMTWPQIEEMSAAGQRFGSHSRNHPDLKGKSTDYLVWQALGHGGDPGAPGLSSALDQLSGGSYDAQTKAVYKSAHYWVAQHRARMTHTTERIFDLQRVRVRGSHTAKDLAALLQLDW